ncbi:Cation/H(+) antiporter 19, partial [Mucuna pruriens]
MMFAIGFLMNTKGLVLNDQTFAICVLMALFTTFITTPIVMAVYKPVHRGAPYMHRTIQRRDLDTELRMLTCFHSSHNTPTLIYLMVSSRGTRKKGKLCIYAMHLMELSERSSAITMVQWASNNGMPFWNKKQDGKDQMIIAFQAYGKGQGAPHHSHFSSQ